jgi:N-acetylmuramoyl-L-alanine amidase
MSSTVHPSTDQEKPNRLGMFRQLRIVFTAAIVLATLYTAWTPVGLLTSNLTEKLAQALAPGEQADPLSDFPTPTPRPKPHIGIVAGHWGNDPGAVCPDGLSEAQINLDVATLVKQNLVSEGFDVDLLEEFDPALTGYRSLALVSIHADSCEYINDQATGFKVAAALATTNPEKAARLTACLRSRYAQLTGLPYHSTSITPDMTSYHAFDEIHNETTAAIIETGFLNLDRQILTQHPDVVAHGITQGILCYIYNEDISGPVVP